MTIAKFLGRAGRVLLASAALLGATCGSSDESCGRPDSEGKPASCSTLCADVEPYRRFPCDKPPHNLCDSKEMAAPPLTHLQVAYVKDLCDRCATCSQNCGSCGAGVP